MNWKAGVGWRGVGLSKLWGFGSRKKIKSTSSEPTSLFQKKISPAQKPKIVILVSQNSIFHWKCSYRELLWVVSAHKCNGKETI